MTPFEKRICALMSALGPGSTAQDLLDAFHAAARIGAEVEREEIAAWLVADDGAKCWPGSGVETLQQAARGVRGRGMR